MYESPLGSEDEGSTDSGGECEDSDEDVAAHSDSTCEDDDRFADFGAPLERMPRVQSADHGLTYSTDHQITALLKICMRSTSSTIPSRSGSFTSVSSTQSYESMYASYVS